MNDSNLKPPTTSEARERGRQGGIASGKARKKRKEMRELVEMALAMDSGVQGMTYAERMAVSLVNKAGYGDVRAFSLVLDLIGESPAKREQPQEEAATLPLDGCGPDNLPEKK